MVGSAASLRVIVPGGRKPLLHPASGLGCESSTSGPSWDDWAWTVLGSKPTSARLARPTPNFLNVARRVTGSARLLVSSSNLLCIVFLCFRAKTPNFVSGFIIGCYPLQQENRRNLTSRVIRSA